MSSQTRINIPISTDIHRATKAAAARQGVTMRKLIQTTLQRAFSFQSPTDQAGQKPAQGRGGCQ